MSDTKSDIAQLLCSESLSGELDGLFLDVLQWAKPTAQPADLIVKRRDDEVALRAEPVARLGPVHAVRIEWPGDSLPGITDRRTVHNRLVQTQTEHLACYVTEDEQQINFVWPRRLKTPTGDRKGAKARYELRSLPHDTRSQARTAVERLAELRVDLEDYASDDIPATVAVEQLNRAFDVQPVTDAFYHEFQAVFGDLERRLSRYSDNRRWAHDYALQFLNRILFLYFVQRKGWLADDQAYLHRFWRRYRQAYRQAAAAEDTFHASWLNILFFEAFCQPGFQAGRSDYAHLPEDIRNGLHNTPYLNGGLFRRNELDRAFDECHARIPDAYFVSLYDEFEGSSPGFFERYNFTVAESTPLDVVVAVDPEMIGRVYESLVNVSPEGSEQHETGIYYTPRVEIDLMCRLSLTDWLTNHLGDQHRHALCEMVMAQEPDDKAEADDKVTRAGLWRQVKPLLETVTVVDPACGSGSFLVGMLQVLDDLLERAEAH